MDLGAVLLTGGTGSFGNAFAAHALNLGWTDRLCIFSRDEVKQAEMRARMGNDPRIRYFLGDVRDRYRLILACQGIRTVIHAAALKQVPACEYNPFEAVQTNIVGTENLIQACIATGVEKMVALSTDKAVSPSSLYGATKCCLERLIAAANAYRPTRFAVVRYGNVAGSRGSVIPVWRQAKTEGRPLILTHPEMTRFWITLDAAVQLVRTALETMEGGEVYVPKLPSFRLRDLAEAMGGDVEVSAIRPGEKLHESLISDDEALYFRPMPHGFVRPLDGIANLEVTAYRSDRNDWWLTGDGLTTALEAV